MGQIGKDKIRKIHVLVHDDTEILGNGQGHAMYRQYLPVIRYVELLKKYNFKSTFYVDMAHYNFLKENAGVKDFQLQAELIEKTILHVLDNGMEVQLHIHSQWLNARLRNNFIYVTNKWNIGQLKENEQVKVFSDCYNLIDTIVKKSKRQYHISSFKAGSWGLQPFDVLYNEFKMNGISLVLGPSKGLKIEALNIDYTNMESAYYPYYCDRNDINKIGSLEEIVIVPMSPTYLGWFDLIRYFLSRKIIGFMSQNDKDLDFDLIQYHQKLDT